MQIVTRRAQREALRRLLALLFVATGAGKALDLRGFAPIIATYRLGIPESLLLPIAVAIAAAEIALGAWLLDGRRFAAAARASILLNTGYALLLASALARGLDLANCGCFGVYLPTPLRWYSPLESLAVAAVSYLLLRRART